MKLKYYCREENQDIKVHDINNESIKNKIQSYMDSREFPALWSPEEYSHYFYLSFNIFFKITQVSKPSKRKFVDIMHLIKLKEQESGNNIYIISTPRGIMFDSECLLNNIGGEVLLKIVM